MEFLKILLVIAAWFFISRFILPRFGVQTCMSGSCNFPGGNAQKNDQSTDQDKHTHEEQ